MENYQQAHRRIMEDLQRTLDAIKAGSVPKEEGVEELMAALAAVPRELAEELPLKVALTLQDGIWRAQVMYSDSEFRMVGHRPVDTLKRLAVFVRGD